MNQTTTTQPLKFWWLLCATWVIVLTASFSAIFIGEILGKTPCTLCWYQRICMFPLVIILGVGCYKSDYAAVIYALPFAIIGTGIALYHSLLYAKVIDVKITACVVDVPCGGDGMTIFGTVALPYLSLVSFSVVLAILLILTRTNR